MLNNSLDRLLFYVLQNLNSQFSLMYFNFNPASNRKPQIIQPLALNSDLRYLLIIHECTGNGQQTLLLSHDYTLVFLFCSRIAWTLLNNCLETIVGIEALTCI